MACGSDLLPWGAAGSSLAAESFELLRCGVCGTAKTAGAPVAEPGELHSGGVYEPARGASERLIRPPRRLGEADRNRSFRGLAAGARILEVGCGDGALAAELAARGFDVTGIEPAEGPRRIAQQRGLTVLDSPVEDADLPAGRFGVVVAWHVLEHLERPDSALRRIREWIDPAGVLIVGIPNLASLQARVAGPEWFHLDLPRHRWHFSEGGASVLLARAGFEVVETRHMVVEQNPFGMWQSLLNKLTRERNYAFRALKRDPALRRSGRDLAVSAAAALPAAIAALALEGAAAATDQGGTVSIRARPADSDPGR